VHGQKTLLFAMPMAKPRIGSSRLVLVFVSLHDADSDMCCRLTISPDYVNCVRFHELIVSSSVAEVSRSVRTLRLAVRPQLQCGALFYIGFFFLPLLFSAAMQRSIAPVCSSHEKKTI
jgi:hypothetical protein